MITAYIRGGDSMFGIRNYIRGYKYTTETVIKYDDYEKLKKIAKQRNRQLRKDRRVERYGVYPVPGCIHGVGQLVLMK
jgi:hypothetical protein